MKTFNPYISYCHSVINCYNTVKVSFHWCNSIIENMLKPKGMLYKAMLLSEPIATIESI